MTRNRGRPDTSALCNLREGGCNHSLLIAEPQSRLDNLFACLVAGLRRLTAHVCKSRTPAWESQTPASVHGGNAFPSVHRGSATVTGGSLPGLEHPYC